MNKKWAKALVILLLITSSSYVVLWIRPFLVSKYGLDPAIIGGLFLVAEIIFNLSLAMMLLYSGVKPNWTNIKTLKMKKFRPARNSGAMVGLAINRAAWVMPFAYILAVGWNRLPWFITALTILEVVITIWVGLLVVGLFDHKQKLAIRPATEDDLDGIVEVDRIAWGDTFPGTREMFAQRIANFPKGGMVVAEYGDRIVASLSLQLINKDSLPPCFTWDSISGNGTLNTHDPDGEWVYGVGLASTPEGSKVGATKGLFLYAGRFIIGQNKKGVVLMARLPGYHRYVSTMTPEEYVLSERKGRPLDPELAIYKSSLMSVMRPVVVLKDYMAAGSDPHSCGYSVMVGWNNVFYGRLFSGIWSRLLRL